MRVGGLLTSWSFDQSGDIAGIDSPGYVVGVKDVGDAGLIIVRHQILN